MKPCKPLVLTDDQRNNMFVTFDTNKFCLYCKERFGFTFLSSYLTKEDLKQDLELNGITNAKFDHGASMMYITETYKEMDSENE